ncbi:MAG TPA: hypothetical protein VMW41_05330 [Candidatus Bathyarchaeia archaeon]|nr:hypothetical protein [Candidatus Bathyarchaeia archaeon]
MNKKVILFSVFLVAILLRCLYFKEAITFTYDQARDALQAIDIWTNDPVKIIGPQTDLKGLYHGPLYWYLISPVYFFTKENVWIVKFFLILANTANLFLIYSLSFSLFKDKKISFLAAFFYAISFETVQYARWLSNPSPAIISTTISFWSLWKLMENKKWALPLLLFSWGLSVQFEFFLIYQISIFVFIWLLAKGTKLPKLNNRWLMVTLFSLIVPFMSFLVAEIKFKGQGLQALLLIGKGQSSLGTNFSRLLLGTVDRLVLVFFHNLWGVNIFLAGLMTLITLYLACLLITRQKNLKKQLILLVIWIISPMALDFFKGTQSTFVTLGSGIGSLILSAYLISYFFARSGRRWLYFLIIGIITFGNLKLIISQNRYGETLFAVQDKMNLGDQLKIIDWIYEESDQQPFHLNTITNPLFINTTWAFLFNWYGKGHYEYMPVWWGETQVDVFGSEINFSPEQKTKLHFLIIEPDPGMFGGYIQAIRQLEDSRSQVVADKQFGNFLVEKRIVTNPRIFTSRDVFDLLSK